MSSVAPFGSGYSGSSLSNTSSFCQILASSVLKQVFPYDGWINDLKWVVKVFLSLINGLLLPLGTDYDPCNT